MSPSVREKRSPLFQALPQNALFQKAGLQRLPAGLQLSARHSGPRRRKGRRGWRTGLWLGSQAAGGCVAEDTSPNPEIRPAKSPGLVLSCFRGWSSGPDGPAQPLGGPWIAQPLVLHYAHPSALPSLLHFLKILVELVLKLEASPC